MTEINDLAAYRRAKLLVADLEKIIKVIDLSTTALSHFSKYAPVNVIISVLQTNQTLLKTHYEKQKRILKAKGKRGDEDG